MLHNEAFACTLPATALQPRPVHINLASKATATYRKATCIFVAFLGCSCSCLQVVLALYSSWQAVESWTQFAPQYRAMARHNPNIAFCTVHVDDSFVGKVRYLCCTGVGVNGLVAMHMNRSNSAGCVSFWGGGVLSPAEFQLSKYLPRYQRFCTPAIPREYQELV